MSREVARILLPDGREHIVWPQPSDNPPLSPDNAVRPTFTTYEQGREWNIKAQEHTRDALSFTQEYAKRIVEPTRGNRIFLPGLADLHWGHNDVDYGEIDKAFDLIESTPDTYLVFGWNLLDAAIPAQFPDGVMWSGQTAQEQVYTFRDKIMKLWKMNKILGAIGDCSCHEGWMKRKTGWMIYRELFGETDIPLLLNGGYLDIQVGKENYRTAHFHKLKYWSVFNKTHGGDRAMDRLVDAEIVFTSHLHQSAVGQSERYNPPFSKDTAVVSTGTFKIHDKHARANYGTEGNLGGQGVMLWADRHQFQVVYDLKTGCEMMWDNIHATEKKKLDILRGEVASIG